MYLSVSEHVCVFEYVCASLRVHASEHMGTNVRTSLYMSELRWAAKGLLSWGSVGEVQVCESEQMCACVGPLGLDTHNLPLSVCTPVPLWVSAHRGTLCAPRQASMGISTHTDTRGHPSEDVCVCLGGCEHNAHTTTDLSTRVHLDGGGTCVHPRARKQTCASLSSCPCVCTCICTSVV